jgi:hypothetical protein
MLKYRVPSADDWSLAIAEWVTAGRRPGETVYLSVDPNALDSIGVDVFGIEEGYSDFIKALREALGVSTNAGWKSTRLVLPRSRRLQNGVPSCTAFLTLLVVCAARRGEKINEYEGAGTELFFPWLRKILGGVPVSTRTGLGELDSTPAPEILLWKIWAEYLGRCGFRSVPQTNYLGSKANWGYALDQAILTFSCRKLLTRMPGGEYLIFRRWIMRREAGRITDPPIPRATKHLRNLLVHRWEDEHVREAVLGAIEGAPSGPRPSKHHLRVNRYGVGQYVLSIHAPTGWSKNIHCGEALVTRNQIQLTPSLVVPELSFRVGQAIQRVKWSPPSSLRFFVSADPLAPSRSGDPEIAEEHFLLVPVEELLPLERARAKGMCDWIDFARWHHWIEFSFFKLFVPRIELSCGTLYAKNHGGVVLRGGIRTGEPGRVPRVLASYQGEICAHSGSGEVTIEETGEVLVVTDSTFTPLPILQPGEYHLLFQGNRTRLEVVDWKQVIYDCPGEPKWLR